MDVNDPGVHLTPLGRRWRLRAALVCFGLAAGLVGAVALGWWPW